MNSPTDKLRSVTEWEVITSRLLVRLTQKPDAGALLKMLRDHRVSSRFLEPIGTDDREARAYLTRDFTTCDNEAYWHFTALRGVETLAEITVVGAAQLSCGEISYCIDPAF